MRRRKVNTPIPRRLSELRQTRGISQKQLGLDAGISEVSASASICQYEAGKHTPNYKLVKKFGEILNVQTPYFYTEDDQMAEIIKLSSSLNKKEKSQTIAYLKKKTKGK